MAVNLDEHDRQVKLLSQIYGDMADEMEKDPELSWLGAANRVWHIPNFIWTTITTTCAYYASTHTRAETIEMLRSRGETRT